MRENSLYCATNEYVIFPLCADGALPGFENLASKAYLTAASARHCPSAEEPIRDGFADITLPDRSTWIATSTTPPPRHL